MNCGRYSDSQKRRTYTRAPRIALLRRSSNNNGSAGHIKPSNQSNFRPCDIPLNVKLLRTVASKWRSNMIRCTAFKFKYSSKITSATDWRSVLIKHWRYSSDAEMKPINLGEQSTREHRGKDLAVLPVPCPPDVLSKKVSVSLAERSIVDICFEWFLWNLGTQNAMA